ncbi:MAG: bifunctional demethylmenaquinone methyltransferase/2-methoxy-6-polyprenyl-1,4-benzoquinol methylase UbiE [Pelagibacterales bacterium]|nr:bifunctional demethylmenaquinone methyltransferase/2-methoxy-6-polyprenyl-1,4-benzoquinol methylase UbiE [Pelagibacterales bacterium]
MTNKVNFGLEKVSKVKKPKLVSNIFSSVSNKYDLMNDAMSFGLHRIWKEKMISVCKPKSFNKILDVATGSGDIALKLLRKKKNLSVICLDENKEMLSICKNRLIDNGFIKDISFIKSSIEDISLDSNSIDIATIAFGFRNFTDHKKALENIYDVLKPGGKLVIMEFTTPKDKIMGKIFETYTDRIIPKLGEFIAKDYDSYKYLAESIKTYYSPNQVLKMFEENKYINNKFIFLPGNIVTIHVGYKN